MFVQMLATAVTADHVGRALAPAPFDRVELAIKATLRLEQSPVAAVRISGDPRLVPCVTTDVRDGRLILGWAGSSGRRDGRTASTGAIVVTARAGCRHEGSPEALVIRVAAPAIAGVTVGAPGVVHVSPMRVPAFAAAIPDRGRIVIDGLRATNTTFSVAGVGRITATGDLGTLRIDIPGQGLVDARTARARALDVVIGGRGDVMAAIDGPATGVLAGSGSITVAGHPDCAIGKRGNGRIVCPAQ